MPVNAKPANTKPEDAKASGPKTERVSAMMTPEETEEIDRYFRSERLKSRSEAVRRLVQLGLETAATLRVERMRA